MDNCVCCPVGKVVDVVQLSKGEGGKNKRKKKTSWVECGALRVKERGRGPESIALFFICTLQRSLTDFASKWLRFFFTRAQIFFFFWSILF